MDNYNKPKVQTVEQRHETVEQMYGGVYGSMFQAVMDLQKRVTYLEYEQERGSSIVISSDEGIENLKEEIRNLKKENERLFSEKEKLENILKKNRENRKNDTSREDLARLKADNNNLTQNYDKISRDYKVLEEKNETLAAENERLYTIAYTDTKTKVMNTNAFNRDFKKRNIAETSIAIFNIRNTKSINENLGRKAGDGLIKTVAGMLAEAFGKENVYRVMGDQFYVLSNDETSLIMAANTVLAKCKDQRIEIIAGFGSGSEAASHNDILAQAEENILRIKKSSQDAQTYMYQNVPTESKDVKTEMQVDNQTEPQEERKPEESSISEPEHDTEKSDDLDDEELAAYMEQF